MKSKSAKHALIVLLASIAISVTAMEVTTALTIGRLKKQAYTEVELQGKRVETAANMLFLASEWVANSFLAGFTDIVVSKSDSTVLLHRIKEEEIRNLDREKIYEKLSSFIQYNRDLSSATLVFEPGILADAPEGIALSYYSSDMRGRNLADEFDVLNYWLYKEIKQAGFATSHNRTVHRDDIVESIIAIQILDRNDKVIGQFWVGTDMQTVIDLLCNYRSPSDIAIGILSKEGELLCCRDRKYAGKSLEYAMNDLYPDNPPVEWYKTITDMLESGESGHFSVSRKQGNYDTFVYSLKNGLNSTLYLISHEDEVMHTTKSFKHIIIMISLLNVLFSACCLAYIFYKFWKINEKKHKLDNELELASSIQKGILPGKTNLPDSISVYGFQHSAKSVGGDLYDYAVRDGKLFFCIGDVSGKGVPAALLMSQICSLFRYLVKQVNDAASIMNALNNAVMDHSEDRMLCSMFIGILDLSNGHIQYCNAGHNPPITVIGGKAEYLKMKANLPIYAFDEYPYKNCDISLTPGDLLFLYTDGVTEARNGDGEFFGNEATLSAVSGSAGAESAAENVLRAVHGFVGGEEQNDDITILSIKYENNDK